MSISVCTLAHGRADHMWNLVNGLSKSNQLPGELVIALMQDDPYDLPDTPFPVRQVGMDRSGIPLAEARNLAARTAEGDLLIFLDVDCIPHPELIGDYAQAATLGDGLLMGEVGYLPKNAPTRSLDFGLFDKIAVKHSERAGPPTEPIGDCHDYRCFWSLNFAISADNFARSEGFDETFVGYGGEDTDFGRTVAENGIAVHWVRGAKAYHQYHPHHMPPVHHLDSVLANAHRFQQKWGEPTMQHWLRAFVLMGLLQRRGDGWVKLREPTEDDLALTRQQEDQPYASSATVLDALEAEAASRAAPAIAAA
ncbi:galactosyltransferase-related protein [Altererythrobacter sp.]|nr:galactosyltransferase-related protein [Altererythrobacter sp.]